MGLELSRFQNRVLTPLKPLQHKGFSKPSLIGEGGKKATPKVGKKVVKNVILGLSENAVRPLRYAQRIVATTEAA